MFLGGPAEEIDSDGFCCPLALGVNLLMVEQISQVLLLLSFALDSPVVQAVLTVVYPTQPPFVPFLSGFLIHLQLLEHVSFGHVQLFLIGIMPKRLLLILLLVLPLLKRKPRDRDTLPHEFNPMISLRLTTLVLLQLQLLDILLP